MCIFSAYQYVLCAHTEYRLFQICPTIFNQLLRITDPAESAREDHLPFQWNENTCSPRPARPEIWDSGNIRWWNIVLAGDAVGNMPQGPPGGLCVECTTESMPEMNQRTAPMAEHEEDDFGVGPYILPDEEEEQTPTTQAQHDSEEDCAYDIDEDVAQACKVRKMANAKWTTTMILR
jgi:hypothetical protein